MLAVSAATTERPAAGAVLRTLLLTDLVDSTKLVETLGDARAYEVGTRHDRVSRDLLPRFHGLEIDKTDGFLLLFERPLDAVGYALAYHQALADLSVELGVQLRARAGIHLGEVFLRQNDPEDVARGAKPLEVEGLAKPTAARAMSLAGGKQTLLTQGAFDLAREAAVGDEEIGGKLRWLAHGPYLFKGVDEPVDIFEVGVEGSAPLAPPADTVKVRRAVAAGDEVTLGWRPGPGLEIPRRPGWRLEKRIGEGGFGEVWLATQPSTAERRVFKFCYDAERLRSLQREVTLFRLLKESLGDRQEILRIHDWNFDQAPYYLEAEYVAGGNLQEWAEAQGGLAEIPLPERLEIVAQVADALAAAHSVGVLHKDVKPANVLIATGRDGRPKAKLTDFGIGEVVDQRELLAKGITVLGLTEIATPEGSSSITGSHLYMAPEVSEGKAATVQADVYALGVILYQVAVADFRRALAPGWRRDVDDELLAQDIASFVDGVPAHRPASAQEVAERLRGLETRRAERKAEKRVHEEAEAQRLALERAQRRRKVLGAVAAAAVAVLAIVSVLAVQAVLARREADKARGIADQRRGQAESLIGFMVGDLRGKLAPLGRLDILDDVGDEAESYFASVPSTELSEEELLQRSTLLNQLGGVRIDQGKLPEAARAFEESLTLAQDLVARTPQETRFIGRLGEAYFWLGYQRWTEGDLEESSRYYSDYLASSKRLVALEPDDPAWQLELAYGHGNVGSVERARGNLESAEGHYRHGIALTTALVESDPANEHYQRELASFMSWLASILEEQGDLAGAKEQFEAEAELWRSAVARDASNATAKLRLAFARGYLGVLSRDLGDLESGLGQSRAQLELIEELTRADPSNLEWRRHLAVARRQMAETLLATGAADSAAQHLEVGLQLARELARADPLNADWRRQGATLGTAAAEVRLAQGRPRAALREAELALETIEQLLAAAPDDRQATQTFARGQILIGRIRAELSEETWAKEAWQLALERIEPLAADTTDRDFLVTWATALYHLERFEEARPIVDRLWAQGYREQRFLELWNLHNNQRS